MIEREREKRERFITSDIAYTIQRPQVILTEQKFTGHRILLQSLFYVS